MIISLLKINNLLGNLGFDLLKNSFKIENLSISDTNENGLYTIKN
jgi:hypothetical protein